MKKIIAVTGCPTGIAHTFMAEEALKTAAKKLNVEIKVETNGASGLSLPIKMLMPNVLMVYRLLRCRLKKPFTIRRN